MKAERKVNIIRALKSEIDFYKRRPVPFKMLNIAELRHLRLSSFYSMKEVIQMPKDVLSPLLIHRMIKAFEDTIMELPIKTEYIEETDTYKASLDLWVKPKDF